MKKILLISLVALAALAGSAESAIAANAGKTEVVAEQKNKKKARETKVLNLSADVDCPKCAQKVTENISFEKGVIDLEVSIEKHTVTITYDPARTDEAKLLAAMKKIGYPATVTEPARTAK